MVKKAMKGRTTCPKCKHEFTMDIPKDKEKISVVCPECNNKFTIKTKCEPGEECSWEEHGEPRKTVLSSIKPKSRKPLIAAVILIGVFSLGITTAVFSEPFIISTTDIFSNAGLTGSLELIVYDEYNNSLEDINIIFGDVTGTTNESGIFTVDNLTLGFGTLQLYGEGYKTQTRDILVYPFLNTEITVTMEEGTGQGEPFEFDSTGCTLILVIFSVFALLGTVTCLRRRHFDAALVGSLISIFSFVFFFIGSLLSIIAFVIIYKSKEEFENGKKGKIF